MTAIFDYLDRFDGFLWSYVGITAILVLGLWLTIRFRFGQLTHFGAIARIFAKEMLAKDKTQRGVRPIQAFFTSIGGCIGIGNIVAVCTAVQIGGPGAIFWMWAAAFLGMFLKYAEVYAGMKYRVANAQGGYDGGPMYYLQQVFRGPFVPALVAFLLCIYGTEVFMFRVVTESITENWQVNHYLVIALLLVGVIYAGMGGVERAGRICSLIIPVFLVVYAAMSGYVLLHHAADIPGAFATIFASAFTGHAAVGGFAGSGLMLAVSQGMARGCYTGDIGVGFASVIHAESSTQDPKKQAALSIFGIFIDTFVVCTLSTLLIVVTDVWHTSTSASLLVQTALTPYFPAMHVFMPFFLLLLGYSSMISFFCVGAKSAAFLAPKRGRMAYFAYASAAFVLFSFVETSQAMTIMSISGGLLLVVNAFGVFRLRREIEFLS